MDKVKNSTCKHSEQLSYKERLNSAERTRYEEKLKLISGTDPYEVNKKDMSSDVSILPNIANMDIINYLVFTPSPYSKEELKSYKSLDAYNQFLCGWVSDVCSAVLNEKVLIKGRVMHSQRMREKPLSPWIITDKTGTVLASHCDCMAGIGETCSHVAAVLFFVEATVRIRDSRTVTQEPAYWLIPKSVKGVTYNETAGINFSSAKTIKRKFDACVDGLPNTSASVKNSSKKRKKEIPPPTENEMASFFKSLQQIGKKPAILTIMKEYSDAYVPVTVKKKLPVKLTSLNDNDAASLSYEDLVQKCSEIDIKVSEEESRNVEIITRNQSASRQWFDYRAGRITASNMKSVCTTDPKAPSRNLVKKVCYPQKGFENEATRWGLRNEGNAKQELVKFCKISHENVQLSDSGLHISTDFPFIAASPDGMITCDCCGSFCVEVKCPFSKKGEMISDNIPYLERCQDGQLRLKKSHPYYFQVQTQLGVTKTECCYFVVWTGADVHIEEITFNPDMWADMCRVSEGLFKTAILPELVGKFYSRLPGSAVQLDKELAKCQATISSVQLGTANHVLQEENSKTNQEPNSEDRFCYCNGPEFGDMIYCDNENCAIKWYHFQCVKLKCKPRTKLWFCPECRDLCT